MMAEKIAALPADTVVVTARPRFSMIRGKTQRRIELQKASRREPINCSIFGSLMR